MMAGVIERNGYSVIDGFIHYHDTPTTFEKAEALCGKRLDHRKCYAISHNEVRELVNWTQTCSGCDGGGCRECGHQGRRRYGHYVPLYQANLSR
jgi:hypothetical protein